MKWMLMKPYRSIGKAYEILDSVLTTSAVSLLEIYKYAIKKTYES